MIFTILSRQDSDHSRAVYEFSEMFSRRYPGRKVVMEDVDTREGAALASLYDVMIYPAFIVTAYDGRLLGLWQGVPVPLIDEVAGLMVETEPTAV